MRTLLVTGGAGFIGSNFVHHIRRHHPDYRIAVLDALTYAGRPGNLDTLRGSDPQVTFHRGNTCDGSLVDRLVAAADIVVHFAAESHVARSIVEDRVFFESDVMGTRAVANAVVRHQARIERFIHISSSEVYGTAEYEPMDERHPLNPTNPYAAAKAGADRLVYSYWRTFHIPTVIVRPFNTYGPRQHLEKLIPRFVTSLLLDEPLTIHGRGTAARDWLHVDDHCVALDRIVHHDIRQIEGQVINLGTGVATDVRTIAERLLELVNRSSERIEYVPDRPGQVAKHVADIAKARSLLGWEPRIALDAGLMRTFQWYLENRAWWEPLRSARRVAPMAREGLVALH